MTPFLLLLVVLSPSPCKPEIPVLLREKTFTSATLAEAVNHYVDLGEEASLKEFESLRSDWGSEDVKRHFSMNERIAWICRIVFQPKGADPLRPPGYGALQLPRSMMTLTAWPLYPVATSGTSYFILSEGYSLGGYPEDQRNYLAYCRANGKFRTERIPVPTRVQALNDLAKLRQSQAWKAINWGEGGEEWMGRYIKPQAENIPAK